MTELLRAAEMRAVEGAAIASGTVTGLELMERAGRGVAAAMFAEWPDFAAAPHRAVVLCGPGNNGGDGFVVARLLHDWGWRCEVFLLGDPDRLPPDARTNCDRWREIGAVQPLDDAAGRAGTADLYLDALFGTGLARPLSGAALAWAEGPGAAPGIRSRTVAVDMPSGLCSDSGRIVGGAGGAVAAKLTVSFHRAKLGQYLADGPQMCGRVAVADIGLGAAPVEGASRLAGAPDPSALAKAGGGHKYGHGHALVLSGGCGRGGAARMAARGALRIGAGLVTVGCPPGALQENATRLDAVMLRSLRSGDDLRALLEDDRLNALCLGPGLGTGEREAGLVAAALAGRHRTVLDADALTLIAREATLFAALHEGCVLTPHAGEFARLFPDIAKKLGEEPMSGPAFSRVDAAREAAGRAGCAVLLKGPDTVIAAPDGDAVVSAACYDRAAPWLATAGAGDVLAGLIAGLLARGLAPMPAAEAAAWLHVEAARRFGPGLIAEDLPEALPGVLRDLGL